MLSIPNETGDDDNLTGRQNEGSNYTVNGGDALTWTGNLINYTQVYGRYKSKAMSKLSSGHYPAGVQDIIKSYFSNIK